MLQLSVGRAVCPFTAALHVQTCLANTAQPGIPATPLNVCMQIALRVRSLKVACVCRVRSIHTQRVGDKRPVPRVPMGNTQKPRGQPAVFSVLKRILQARRVRMAQVCRLIYLLLNSTFKQVPVSILHTSLWKRSVRRDMPACHAPQGTMKQVDCVWRVRLLHINPTSSKRIAFPVATQRQLYSKLRKQLRSVCVQKAMNRRQSPNMLEF